MAKFLHVVVQPVQRFGHAVPKGVSVTLCWLHVAGLPQPLTRPAGVLLYFGITRGWLARLLSASVLQLALCGVCGRAARKRAAVSRRRQLRRKRGVDSDDSELDDAAVAARAVCAKAERARMDDLYAVVVHQSQGSSQKGNVVPSLSTWLLRHAPFAPRSRVCLVLPIPQLCA